MVTYLAQNEFIPNPSVPQPPTEVSTADSEYRLQNVARPDVADGRDRQPISNSTLAPATGVDTATSPVFADPPVAVLISNPDGGYMGPRLSPALGTSVVSEAAVPLRAASDPAIPSSNEWRPAPRCTEPHDGACNCEYAQCDDFDRPDCKAKAAGLDPWPDGAVGCLTAADEALYWQLRRADDPFTRDLPDIPDPHALFDAIEPPPLFLQRAIA